VPPLASPLTRSPDYQGVGPSKESGQEDKALLVQANGTGGRTYLEIHKTSDTFIYD